MRFSPVALCLLLPVVVAVVGGEAVVGDASALIQAHAALAPEGNASVNLRSLMATAQADLLKRTAQSHVESGASKRAVALSTIQPRLQEAARYLQGAAAKANQTRRAEKCSALCIIATVTDAFWIMYETGAMLQGQTDTLLCSGLTLLLWWGTGLAALTVDGDMTFAEAVHVMSQQVTSIGYGSTTPSTTGMKIFNGLSSVLSQMSVGRVTADMANRLLVTASSGNDTPTTRTAALFATVAISTIYFASDLYSGTTDYPKWWDALLDAFYLAMMTMTTVGYGDLALNTKAGKIITPLGLPLLTNAFAGFTGHLGGPSNDAPAEESSPELCKCFGTTYC